MGAVTPHDDSGFDGTIRNYYTFSITNVTNPSESINQIACSGNLADATLSGPASTGGTAPTQKVQRFENLRLALDTQSRNGFTTSCPTAATAGGFTCTVQGPGTCTAPTLYVLGSNNPTGISVGGTGLTNAGQLMGSYTALTTGSRPTWSFNVTAPVSGSAGDNLNISAVTCNGSNTFSPASTPNTGKYAYIRINNLANSLATNGRNSYSTSCSPAATAGSVNTSCTITGPAGAAACTNMVLSPDATITASQPALAAGSGATAPVWTFNISNATTASKTIASIQCGGTNTFNTISLPNSGNPTLLPYQRVNNLTQGTGTGLQTIGINGYSYSCQTATATSVPGVPGVQCTVTGPPGVANCANIVGTLEVGANITVANITRTSAGSASTAAAEDFQPFLATVTPFGNGSSAQSYSKTDILGVNSGTINTSATAPNTEFMSNGSPSSTQTIPTNATGSAPNVRTLGGGSDPDPTTNHWSGVGVFKRVDIVPGVTAYNRTSGRTDCVGVTCTYAEELQNFSNWYTYYRTRMQMMKAATTQAFTQLNGSYRVGFDNICAASGSNVIRTVAQFVDSGGEVSNQRTNWWSSLTSSSPSCATPLRAETAKIGRYYGHKLGVVADPLQYSCQQNFTILVTDGYWNENEPSATSLTGGDIGNVDNNSATVPRPFFDGAQASTSCPATGSQRNLNASSCRTLADIAWYYYSTDLRSAALGNATGVGGADVATDNVQITSDDPNQAQHVNFFAMGLGIDGFLNYRSDYQTAGSGDYANIKSGSANWPAVSNLDPSGVDDLWHATVNGHGKYFSARNLPAVVSGLREALNKIGSRVGAASAAATSNLEPVNGDNFAYVASYATSFWVGDLQSRSIDLTTGQVSPDTNCGVAGSGCQWSAQAKLDNLTWSARRLFLAPTSNTSGDPLRSFDYNNFNVTEQGYFNPSSLSQYTILSVSNPADITTQKLTEFLRGFRGLEQDGDITHPQIWRQRSHVLGDVVNTQPTFMKAPNLNYTDPGYVGFKTSGTAASRRPVVFVSAQDGMLHAFNADTAAVTVSGAAVQPGEEMWAYVPKQVMPVMKTLADVNYIHRYFVDGPITVSDVNFGVSSNDWHTILVAGQGAGGNSYLALDVTDPLNPLYLWEFTDSGLGNTISNSTITKLADGTWAVIFTSGYNNADGIGRVYALNPKTGLIKTGYPLSNGSGSGAFPSNLGKMAVVAIDPALNNTIKYVYAGDLNGDLWRFDFTGLLSLPVFKLAHLASGATVQPITTKPEVSLLADGTQVVYVGTGKYLETADLANTDPQTFYAIKDTLGAPNLGGASQSTWDPKTDTITVGGSTVSAFLIRKFLSVDDLGNPLTRVVGGTTQSVRAVCPGASSAVSASTQLCVNTDTTTMDWSTYGGWMVDLPDTGERLNVDMKLVLGTLVFASNIPQASSCTVGGSAVASELDSTTGLGIVLAVGVPADIFVGSRINNALVVGVTVIKLASGQYIAELTLSSTLVDKKLIHVCTTAACSVGGTQNVNPGGFSGQRGQWREFEAY